MAAMFDPEHEKKAIYETLQTLVHCIDTGDVATIRSLIYPKGRVARSRNGQISYYDFDEFSNKIETDLSNTSQKLSETLHEETYQIPCVRPDFAVIWFASTLLADNIPVSYIVNAMSLHKRDGKWKFSTLADSGVSLSPDRKLPDPGYADFRNPDEEKEVRKVISTFFDSLTAFDVDGLISTIWAPDAGAAMSRRHLPPPNPDLILVPLSDLIQKYLVPMFDPSNPLKETFDDYAVLIHENLAAAVGVFKVYQGKERVLRSFGWNMFTLLKKDGVWKISNAADTSDNV
jgi:hypothetical protein